ncbi:MAG TPA: EAL domain-containing protein [Xanthobacteraceae bacterium]
MKRSDFLQWARWLLNGTSYFGLAIIAIIWSGVLWSEHNSAQNFLSVTREHGKNLASAFEESVIRSVSEVDKTLLLLRARYLLDPQRFDIRRVATNPLYSSALVKNAALIDANGFMVNSGSSQSGQLFDLHDREHFQTFLTDHSDRLYIGRPIVGRASNTWVVPFARPIIAADGSFKGVITLGVDPAMLTRFYEVVDIGKQGRISLIGEDDYVRAAKGASRNILGQKLNPPLWKSHLDGDSFYAQAFDGVRRLITFRKVKGLPLIVGVAFSQQELMAELLHDQEIDDFLAAGITVLILLGIVLDAEQRRRVDEAREAARASGAVALEKSRELEVTLDHMSQGLMMVDGARKVAVINHRAIELLSLPADFVEGQRPFEDVVGSLWEQGDFGQDGETLDPKLRDFVKAGGLGEIGVYERTRPNGTTLEVRSVPLAGGGFVRTFTDVTLRKDSEERIAHMARHDELTGLANRVLFRERIEQAIARARRTNERFAVLLLDLDRFKDVNDTMGHPAGDALLKVAAQRLCRTVRETDTVARFGGDEFAIVQTSVENRADVERLCTRILEAIKEPFEIEGHGVDMATSIGIAVAPDDGLEAEGLLKNADIALYAVKTGGRGSWRFFEPAMEAQARARSALEHDLRHALAAGELDVVYQPTIDLDSNEVSGVEALLRWNHPGRGLIMPGEFIPVAEEIGLISEIGEWVLKTACAAATAWPAAVRVAVNLSPVQFKDRRLAEIVKNVLASTGLPAQRLELEITETVVLQENQANRATLQELGALGVTIALDDFGIGYSSLSYLRAFPFSKIKIDQSFVMELCDKSDNAPIVRAIADLGRSLGVPTIAEGVETSAQLRLVRAAGCKEAQGFLFSRPVAVSDVPAVIARRKSVAVHAA